MPQKRKRPAGRPGAEYMRAFHRLHAPHDTGCIIDRLDGVRQTGMDRSIARCPAYEDRLPSLPIGITDDGEDG